MRSVPSHKRGKMKKFAFTLAEVLITLGIIGIVAALTLPTIIQNYQKRVTVEGLKKEYTLLQQALKMYQADNGIDFDQIDTTLPAETFMQKYILPYVETIEECERSTKCYKDYPLAIDRKTKLMINGKFYILKDGSFLGISRSSPSGKVFYIDINGAKGPNFAGRDIFFFYYVNKKTILYMDSNGCNDNLSKLESGLYPGGYSSCYIPFTNYPRTILLGNSDRTCSKNANNINESGDACAALIMLDGWKIEKDYPW